MRHERSAATTFLGASLTRWQCAKMCTAPVIACRTVRQNVAKWFQTSCSTCLASSIASLASVTSTRIIGESVNLCGSRQDGRKRCDERYSSVNGVSHKDSASKLARDIYLDRCLHSVTMQFQRHYLLILGKIRCASASRSVRQLRRFGVHPNCLALEGMANELVPK